MRILITAGAKASNINLRDVKYINSAAKSGESDALKWLINKGADASKASDALNLATQGGKIGPQLN